LEDKNKGKGKSRTLVTAPLCGQGPAEALRYMARTKAGSHIPALYLSSRSRYTHLPTPKACMEGWVNPGPWCKIIHIYAA